MSWFARRIAPEEGAAAVEFALVIGILVLLLVGIVQFGHVFNQWQQLEHATREGARWASLRNSSADVRAVTQAAAPGLPLAAGAISVSPDPTTAVTGAAVTVSASVQVPVFAPIMARFLGQTVNLRATATQRVEG